MRSKNSQVLKNDKQLSIATLLAFGSCLWMISGSAVVPVAYGRSLAEGSATLASGEISHAEGVIKADISHAEGVIKADTSHVAQSLIYLPQVIRIH
jgi:hypothetical protein